MITSATDSFNANALNLAAKMDSAFLCRQFFGRAYGSSEALRIAAENKSYSAAEAMLTKSAEYAAAPNSLFGFSYGEDWDRVKEIAKTDARLNALLTNYEAESERTFNAAVTSYTGKPGKPQPQL